MSIIRDTAKQLTNIMMTHLSMLDPQDRATKIAAGKKVLSRKSATVKRGATSSVASDKFPKGTSSGGTVRLPLTVRGR